MISSVRMSPIGYRVYSPVGCIEETYTTIVFTISFASLCIGTITPTSQSCGSCCFSHTLVMISCKRVHTECPADLISTSGLLSSPSDLWFFNREIKSRTTSPSNHCSAVWYTVVGWMSAVLFNKSWKYSFHL